MNLPDEFVPAPAVGPHKRSLVALQSVSKSFSNGTLALSDMSLVVKQGEFVSLLRPSGCGKSTALRIGGGLALIAAVVAEFAAGSAGAASGLAFRLLEAQFRLNIPRLFAALFLLSLLGVAIFALTSLISWWSLHRWHESSIKREN